MLELCGSENPAVAKRLHPQSLRALYGETTIRNAVHCSTSAENAVQEVGLVLHKLSAVLQPPDRTSVLWIAPPLLDTLGKSLCIVCVFFLYI